MRSGNLRKGLGSISVVVSGGAFLWIVLMFILTIVTNARGGYVPELTRTVNTPAIISVVGIVTGLLAFSTHL